MVLDKVNRYGESLSRNPMSEIMTVIISTACTVLLLHEATVDARLGTVDGERNCEYARNEKFATSTTGDQQINTCTRNSIGIFQ